MQTGAREARDCCLAPRVRPGEDDDEDEEQFARWKQSIRLHGVLNSWHCAPSQVRGAVEVGCELPVDSSSEGSTVPSMQRVCPGSGWGEGELSRGEPKGAIARRAGAEEEGKDRLQAHEEPSVSTGW